jgi:hypothetical protein
MFAGCGERGEEPVVRCQSRENKPIRGGFAMFFIKFEPSFLSPKLFEKQQWILRLTTSKLKSSWGFVREG